MFSGGGSCADADACEKRSKTAQGSSKKNPHHEDCKCMNYDVDGNKLDCTCVYLPYCDGALYAGHLDEPYLTSNGTKLMIRGRRNLDASIDILLQKHGLANASDLVITGESQGAITVLLSLDSIAARMPSGMKVRGVPVAGFALDHKNANTLDGPLVGRDNNNSEITYMDTFEWVFNFHNTHQMLSAECMEEYHDRPWFCMVGSNAAHFVKTPMFVLNSKHDSWQLHNILGLDWHALQRESEGTGKLLPAVVEYGKDFMEQLDSFIHAGVHHKTDHAAYITSQICHASDCCFNTTLFQDAPVTKLLGRWYSGSAGGLEPAVFVENRKPYYGNSC